MGTSKLYTTQIADEICERLSQGESLRSICRDEHMPAESTVRLWVINDTNSFAAQYARARDIGLDSIADELFEIADNGTNDWIEKFDKDGGIIGWQLNQEALARSRLRFDQRRWHLSKLAPKKYGDKIQQEISNPDGSLQGMSEAQIAMKLETIQRAATQRLEAHASADNTIPPDNSDLA